MTIQNKEKKLNAVCYLFLMFLIGSFGGWLYEEVFYWITEGALTDRGVLYGPWLPIYGIGIVAIYALKPFKKNPVALFLISAGLSGVWEYIVGWVILQCFGLRLWDYRSEFANIGGIVCLRSVVTFGLCGLLFHYVVEPAAEHIVKKLKDKTVYGICLLLAGVFLLDCILSFLSRTPITY